MRRLGPSILGRFGLMFLALVALPTLVLLSFLSQLAVSSLYEVSASQAKETGHQILDNLNSQVDIVSYQAAALLYDKDLEANVNLYASAATESRRADAAAHIDSNLINFLDFSNKAGTVTLLTKSAGWYSYGNLSSPAGQQPENEQVAREAVAQRGRVVFLDRFSGDVLTAGLAPALAERRPELRLILLRLRIPFAGDLQARRDSADKTEVILLGRAGQILLSTLDAATQAAFEAHFSGADQLGDQTQNLAGQMWLTSGQRVEATGWTLITLRNEAGLTARFQGYQPWILSGLGLLALLFLGYTALFFSSIAKPIQKVVDSMDLVGEGAWGIRIPNVGLRELNVLVDSFNRMSGEIVRLNQERVAVELDALRHQINPHFIANTLNVVKLMASTARLKTVEQMTGDLMLLLADSYTGGTSLTELASELKNVESYVRIMKVRFDTGFDLEVDIPPEVAGALTLRMLLQPLVENSVIHGFLGLARRGLVVIRAHCTEASREFPLVSPREDGVVQDPARVLVLQVEDNGVGMDPGRVAERRADPLQRPDRLARIGLDNVDRRIRLHFGDNAGLQITSEPGRFTRVTLVLPLMTRSFHA